MNSRFKFRAWSIEEKKYYLDVENTYADDYRNCSFVPNTQKIDEHYNFGGILDDPGYIVEQCTGLKDKNGRLVFEGDIVKTAIGEIGVVVFFDAQFAVIFENDFYISVAKTKEIVGNIHEDQFREVTKLMESGVEDE